MASAAQPRKRNRKRKRRVASSDSSSSSSSSSDSPKSPIAEQVQSHVPPEPSSESSSSESDSADDELDDVPLSSQPRTQGKGPKEAPPRPSSSSPPPPSGAIPPFIPPSNEPGSAESEQLLKERFRKFWMAAVADGFADDLEEIRKEPNLNSSRSRLALLVDSLASGADVFTSSVQGDGADVNEMEFTLDSHHEDEE